MSVRITITITEKPEDKSVDIARKVEGESSTEFERKMAVWYLLGLGRGLAHFGIERNDPAILGSAADFVGEARDIYGDAAPVEGKA